MTIEQALVNIENDLRACRTSLQLNYGQLTKPDKAPTASWSGSVSNSDTTSDDEFMAAWDITFTRTDGANATPLVDIGWDYNVDNSIGEFIAESLFRFVCKETGANFIRYRLGLMGGSQGFYNPYAQTTAMSLSAQAISPVAGTLKIERAYGN